MNLPAWAADIVPVDMEGAAAVLGISRRTLVYALKDHPHYERRGSKKVFYPEHIALLERILEVNGPRTKMDVLRIEMAKRLEPTQQGDLSKFLDRETAGKVYIIRCNDRVKIGFASNFPQRLRVLSTACPHPVDVIAVLDGDRKLEGFLHKWFARHRRHGEWFDEADDLAEVIAAMEAVQ